jgi:putative RecB family exonuclease
MVPTHNSGKVPKPQYAKDAFFAMNIYTELLEQEHGITAEQLRLVYIKNGNRDDVKRQDVTPESRARTVEGIEGLWGDITAAARIGEFPPRTSVLCGWCHFQDICPAFANENRIF